MSSIIRILDHQGRITIPSSIRILFNWQPDDPLKFEQTNKGVLITTVKSTCIFCNEHATLYYKNKPICKDCLDTLTKLKS